MRTESYAFYCGTASQPIDAHGITQNSAFSAWHANTAYSVGTGIKRKDSNGKYHLYCVTTTGTTGATQPSPGRQREHRRMDRWFGQSHRMTLYKVRVVNSIIHLLSLIRLQAWIQLCPPRYPGCWALMNALTPANDGAAQMIGDNTRFEFGLTSQNAAVDFIASATGGASRLKWPGRGRPLTLPASTIGIIDMNGYGFGLANGPSWYFHDIPCVSGNCDKASFFAGSSQGTNAIVQACPPYATSSTCANPYWYVDGSGTDHITGGNTFGSSSSQTAARVRNHLWRNDAKHFQQNHRHRPELPSGECHY